MMDIATTSFLKRIYYVLFPWKAFKIQREGEWWVNLISMHEWKTHTERLKEMDDVVDEVHRRIGWK